MIEIVSSDSHFERFIEDRKKHESFIRSLDGFLNSYSRNKDLSLKRSKFEFSKEDEALRYYLSSFGVTVSRVTLETKNSLPTLHFRSYFLPVVNNKPYSTIVEAMKDFNIKVKSDYSRQPVFDKSASLILPYARIVTEYRPVIRD